MSKRTENLQFYPSFMVAAAVFMKLTGKFNELIRYFCTGGVFIEGAGDDYFFGPDFIVEKRTILVTHNYRLGIFGFLSLNSTEYSGNMGLKDQQLALKWIHSNIHRFGGDNKRITVFGHSAGTYAVQPRKNTM